MMVQSKKGFTLIELMIVVAIIGVLAAVAIPAYSNYVRKAKLTEVTNAMGAVGSAAIEYYQSRNEMPGAMTTRAAIANSLGISIPTTYVDLGASGVTWTPSGTAGTIQATLRALGGGCDGETLTLTVQQGRRGSWGGTVPDSYIPKQ